MSHLLMSLAGLLNLSQNGGSVLNNHILTPICRHLLLCWSRAAPTCTLAQLSSYNIQLLYHHIDKYNRHHHHHNGNCNEHTSILCATAARKQTTTSVTATTYYSHHTVQVTILRPPHAFLDDNDRHHHHHTV